MTRLDVIATKRKAAMSLSTRARSMPTGVSHGWQPRLSCRRDSQERREIVSSDWLILSANELAKSCCAGWQEAIPKDLTK